VLCEKSKRHSLDQGTFPLRAINGGLVELFGKEQSVRIKRRLVPTVLCINEQFDAEISNVPRSSEL